ncbi:Transmembrane protein 49, partial [Paramicrosporidium saccamoebae]
MQTVERITKKKGKKTLFETLQLASYQTVTRLGFFGILLCASTSFVIFLFSRDYLEQAITLVKTRLPSWGHAFHDWLLTQRAVFQERRPDPIMDKISTVWHVFLALMMTYFILSAIRSAAIMQARREGLL